MTYKPDITTPMKPDDKKYKKKKNEEKSMDEGKLINEPKPEIGYGIRTRPRIDQSKVLSRRTIRL